MKASVRTRLLACVLLLAGLAACSDSGPSAPPVVASVQIGPAASGLVPGNTHALTATARDAKGNPIAGAVVTWASSDAGVVTVTDGGLVTAVGAGVATVTATSGGQSGSVEFTIAPGGMVGGGGGSVTTPNSGVTLTFPAGAVPAETKITVAPTADPTGNEHVVSGTSYEFGPDGTQFAQPVTLELRYDPQSLPPDVPPSALRVAKLVGGKWQILTEGASVDSVAGRVRASIRSFSSYGVVRDPCVVGTLPTGTTAGKISTHDCLYPVAGRRSDYYAFSAPAGQLVTVTTDGTLQGIMGIKAATEDPTTGTVWNSGTIGGSMRLVSNGSLLQLFVSSQDSTEFGEYSVTRSTEPLAHSCSTQTVLMPGVSIHGSLSRANSCEPTVKFSPVPQAIGKPLWTHYYPVKLEAGKRYTITLGGLGASFDPSLAVFAGGQLVAHATPDDRVVVSRTVTVTPATTVYHTIEIGSGKFSDGTFTTWVNQTGSYTLSISR